MKDKPATNNLAGLSSIEEAGFQPITRKARPIHHGLAALLMATLLCHSSSARADSFQGVDNQPLGNAVLTVQSNQLVVSNLGVSGADGVSLDFKGMQFGALTLGDLNLSMMPTGAVVSARAFGEVNGVANQLISALHASNNGGALELTPEFNLPYPTLLNALLYDGPNLVGSARGLTGVVARVVLSEHPFPQDSQQRWIPFLPANGLPWIEVDLPSRPSVQLSGGQPIQGTRLMIAPNATRLTLPDITFTVTHIKPRTGLDFWYKDVGALGHWGRPGDPAPDHFLVGGISRIEAVAQNLQQLRILSEQPGIFGFAHSVAGGAKLSVSNDILWLDGGANALDGGALWFTDSSTSPVENPLPIDGLNIRWQDPEAGAVLPAGAFVRVNLNGSDAAGTNQYLGFIQAQRTGTNSVAISADFSSAGSFLQRVEVWRDDTMVGSTVASNGFGNTVVQFPLWFWRSGPLCDPRVCDPPPSADFVGGEFGWDSNILIQLSDGNSFLGNRIRIFAADPILHPSRFAPGLAVGGGLTRLGIMNELASPAGQFFKGFSFTPVGAASLSNQLGELVVSRLSPNANFGTSIALGDAGGAALGVSGLDESALDGSEIRVHSYGMLDGIPDQLIGSMIASKVGTNILFSPDLVPLGAQDYSVTVFDGLRMVGTAHLLAPVPRPIVTIPAKYRDLWPGQWKLFRPGSFVTHLDLPERLPVTIEGQSPVFGTRIVINACLTCGNPSPQPSLKDIGAISRLEVIGSGLSSLRILKARPDMFNQLHEAVGSAHLFAVGSDLHLTNPGFGSTSIYGIDDPLDPPLCPELPHFPIEHWWHPLVPPIPRPMDSMLEVILRGVLSGGLDQAIAASRATSLGNGTELSADFSSLGVSSRLVEVLNSGNVVFSTSVNGSTGAVAQISDWPSGSDVNYIIGPMFSNTVTITWVAAGPIQVQLNNQLVTGDQIRISAQVDPYPSSIFSSVRLQAAGIPELIFGDAAAHPATPIRVGIQRFENTAAVTWTPAGARQVLQTASSVLGPWEDVTGASAPPCVTTTTGASQFFRVRQF